MSDIYAHLIGQWLSARLHQPFVIENRPGVGNNIGIEAVVKAAVTESLSPSCSSPRSEHQDSQP
jgi:tripartite-type tricarboxylate transporter receptor subunit TctC